MIDSFIESQLKIFYKLFNDALDSLDSDLGMLILDSTLKLHATQTIFKNFLEVTSAHGPSRQPMAYRSPPYSLAIIRGSILA